ncbi:hypothetical protein KIL84_009644 [Mauremys mutica]|uniref:Uncharacterized protein n=1 Tax=Mauremys mutica TaxID=74926 RepID=A0A9D4B696_9SAUR|nr:hypothetical protein KIL84_009644 [Mauremys mutica]
MRIYTQRKSSMHGSPPSHMEWRMSDALSAPFFPHPHTLSRLLRITHTHLCRELTWKSLQPGVKLLNKECSHCRTSTQEQGVTSEEHSTDRRAVENSMEEV